MSEKRVGTSGGVVGYLHALVASKNEKISSWGEKNKTEKAAYRENPTIAKLEKQEAAICRLRGKLQDQINERLESERAARLDKIAVLELKVREAVAFKERPEAIRDLINEIKKA
jgi:hypothetical protein